MDPAQTSAVLDVNDLPTTFVAPCELVSCSRLKQHLLLGLFELGLFELGLFEVGLISHLLTGASAGVLTI